MQVAFGHSKLTTVQFILPATVKTNKLRLFTVMLSGVVQIQLTSSSLHAPAITSSETILLFDLAILCNTCSASPALRLARSHRGDSGTINLQVT